MSAAMLGRIAFALLLALQAGWYLAWAPPQSLPPALAASLACAPLLPPAIGLLLGRPSALFWGALVSLLYFSHGVMEAWTTPAVRGPALLEVGLSLLLVGAVGADGLRRRRAVRQARDAHL